MIDTARRVIANAIAARIFPAASLEVGTSADVLWREALGTLTFDEAASSAAEDTPFDLASLTKVIATTPLVLQLADDGRLGLAYPVAAYAVGRLVGDGTRARAMALAALAGLALIHLGGLAQLLILTGSVTQAARLGTLPFIAGDLAKVALAILVLRSTVSATRARL